MRIQFLEQTYEINSINGSEIVEFIEDLLDKNKLYFSHAIINNDIVYNLEEYLMDNIGKCKNVEIIGKPLNELIKDILTSLADYIDRAMQQIEELSDRFAKTPKKDDWNNLLNLIEGIEYTINTYEYIDRFNNDNKVFLNSVIWEEYRKDIQVLIGILNDFNNAIKNQDLISISDILGYEIIPLFVDIKVKIDKMLVNLN